MWGGGGRRECRQNADRVPHSTTTHAWEVEGEYGLTTNMKCNSQLRLKILHDAQKRIVHLWLLCELQLDRVYEAEGVADIEGMIF